MKFILPTQASLSEICCCSVDAKAHTPSVTSPAGYRKRAREAPEVHSMQPHPEDIISKHSKDNALLRSVDWDEPEDEMVLKVLGELPSLNSCLHLPETSIRKSHQRQIREAVGLQVCSLNRLSWTVDILDFSEQER